MFLIPLERKTIAGFNTKNYRPIRQKVRRKKYQRCCNFNHIVQADTLI